jgi:ABC-type antimicrobial peptide transport system permease subunit
MRIVDYILIASKDLQRQLLRSSLTIFALIISTVILVTMVAISIGGKQAIADQFGSDASLSIITVTPNQSGNTLSPFGNVQEVNSGATTLNDDSVRRIAAIPNVQSASPRAHIWEFNQFSLGDATKQFVAQTEGVAYDASLPLKVGSKFSSNDNKNVAILGFAYAKALGHESDPTSLVGKTLLLTTQKGYRGAGATIPSASASKQEVDIFNQSTTKLKATVVGVTNEGPDQNSVFVPLGWAHDIRTAHYNESSGSVKAVDQIANDGYSTVQVKATSPNDAKAVGADIGKLGYGQVSTISQVERLQQFSMTMWIVLGAVAIIAIVAATLGVVNTMLMAVSEQRYVIGVWRACGARRSFIINLFLVEAMLLGLIGGLIGTALSVFVSTFVNSYVGALLKAQGLTLTNIAIVPLWLMVGTVILTSLFCIIAGLYPAYKAARLNPAQALNSGQ